MPSVTTKTYDHSGALQSPSEPCWDCGHRKGIHPAVEDRINGRVWYICQKCYNLWRPFMPTFR
jgi:hypothetical protein